MFFWQNDNKAITQSFSRDLVNWLNILAFTNNNNLNNNNNNLIIIIIIKANRFCFARTVLVTLVVSVKTRTLG